MTSAVVRVVVDQRESGRLDEIPTNDRTRLFEGPMVSVVAASEFDEVLLREAGHPETVRPEKNPKNPRANKKVIFQVRPTFGVW